MELGVYSFGDVQKNAETGELGSTADAMRNLLEAIQLADEVGLDYFGIGEHHTREMPASAATVVLGAAASTTKNIKLGSAVTVLSTDDPVRVFNSLQRWTRCRMVALKLRRVEAPPRNPFLFSGMISTIMMSFMLKNLICF